MIRGRNKGDNITLINTLFYRSTDPKDNKFKEHLTLLYKDCDTGQKYIEEIIDPDYEYFVAKEDNRVNYPRLFIEKDAVESVVVPYKDLEKDIAKRTGLTDYFYENIKNGNRYENKKLHTHPDIFNSDMNIEDHYRYRFGKLYKNEPCQVSKAYFDIEADTIHMEKDFPEPGECPINAVTIILQDQQKVYTFLLRNKANPQIEEFENTVKDGSIFPELHDFIIQSVGGPEMAAKYNINFSYNFLFYDEDDEIHLLIDVFKAINSYRPDFALAWNMSFDVPYIIERIKRLGYNPADILSTDDYKYKIAEYYIDERNKNEFAERGDFALISSHTVYLDQMIQFASRRKGQSRFISFALNDIGEQVAKVKKLDYKNITSNISLLPYKNYKIFVLYNIMDVVVQYCIEAMTGDIDYVFSKCNMNNTRYSKAHRQTVYLTNRGIKEFYNTDDGYIMGNNVNKFNTKPEVKFPGAFVADPSKINNYSRLRLYGRPVNIFDLCIDLDYSSLYPSVLRQWNIAPNTQIGKITIPVKVFDNENPANLDNWTRAGKFIEDFQSNMILEFCTRWFRLSSYTQLYYEVIDFFTTKAMPGNGLTYRDRDGYIIPMDFGVEGQLQEAMIFEDNRREVDEKAYYKPDKVKWKEYIEHATQCPNQHF